MNSIFDDPNTLFAIYKSLFKFNPDPCYAIDRNGKFILINQMAKDLTGYSKEEFSKLSFLDLIVDEFKESMNELFIDVLTNEKVKSFEVSIKHKTGTVIELYGTSVPIIVGNQVLGVAGIVKDITEKNFMQGELERTKIDLESIFNNIDVCVWSTDFEHEVVYQISSACKKIYGYSQEEFTENPNLWKEVIHPDDVAYVENMQPKLAADRQTLKLEYRIIDANQNIKWVSNYTTPIFNESGDLVKLNGVVVDIHQRRLAEEKLEFMAFHDELTDLPNRRLFEQLLDKAILNAKKENKKIAILFFDLDEFKWINDTLGHTVGDKVLTIVAKRLKDILKKGDIVSRLGGDEFIILLQNIDDIKEVETEARKLIDAILNPIYLGERCYVLTASIGISIFPDHTTVTERLIIYADQALNAAKRDSKNTYKFYKADFSEELCRKLDVLQALRQALYKDSMTLHYQPIIDIRDKSIVGFEALLRWNDPTLGMISPSEFIPIAEESGLIIPLGEWVFHKACIEFNELYRNCDVSAYLSVNVSTKQFEDELFLSKLIKILNETNFDPKLLKIELTESIMMKNIERTIAKLHQLKELGIEVFLDDFGTGYSSLNYLGLLPINTLKIDRSFIQNINASGQEAIVHTIISMANSLDKGIIAEGVEEEYQLLYLEKLGCYNIQGYLFSKPIPFKEIPNFIDKGFIRK
ncbi:EAL domain-containing protein [Lysinibacillus telephonicus]|uniref:EAL domain-containing protein n=1 Tax=Lysinibacillus telephonicus TaxID=1714840 RepID=A0A431UVI2_9BACI|nr:EAL domain-containing protein [Lysinibacillus telephonicus]RTQ94906.1 EAL domain-containing protein [Lysinibacillus telephonicus]